MNFDLPHIPERPPRPREKGITMVMDKGVSLRHAEDMVSACSDMVDLVKLGFGTSYLTKDLEKKLALYREAGMRTYFGGTLFEAFVVRGMFNEYVKLLDKFKVDMAEVSDGSIVIPHTKMRIHHQAGQRPYRAFRSGLQGRRDHHSPGQMDIHDEQGN
jgi:phosphosulfolactate synthase